MTASVSPAVFFQWLLARPASKASACAIILHGHESTSDFDHLIQDIANYLNEYDDAGDGRWLPATTELVERVVRDPNHRQLLDMDEFGSSSAPVEWRNTLTALGQRGHVVFRSPGASDEELDLANTFHAGVGQAPHITEPCHVILDPNLLDRACIAQIIGDVFLEWLNCEFRRKTMIHEIG